MIDEMIKRAARDERFKPRHHAGTGFIQAYIKKDVRLHVMHPSFPATRVGQVHNHRFSFKSEVLHGLLINEVYGLRTGEDFGLWEVYCGGKRKGFHTSEPKLLGNCDLELIEAIAIGWDDDHLCQDGEYSFEAGMFHKSVKCSDYVITRMTKVWEGPGDARVIAPAGEVLRHAFDEPVPEAKLWEAIRDALRRIDEC